MSKDKVVLVVLLLTYYTIDFFSFSFYWSCVHR